jgi:GT2 family glycosyltransferase
MSSGDVLYSFIHSFIHSAIHYYSLTLALYHSYTPLLILCSFLTLSHCLTHSLTQRHGIDTALARSTNKDDAIVLLNSDVVVTKDWLFTMYQALQHDNETMIVGPLSNAGTIRSVVYVALDHSLTHSHTHTLTRLHTHSGLYTIATLPFYPMTY